MLLQLFWCFRLSLPAAMTLMLLRLLMFHPRWRQGSGHLAVDGTMQLLVREKNEMRQEYKMYIFIGKICITRITLPGIKIYVFTSNVYLLFRQ